MKNIGRVHLLPKISNTFTQFTKYTCYQKIPIPLPNLQSTLVTKKFQYLYPIYKVHLSLKMSNTFKIVFVSTVTSLTQFTQLPCLFPNLYTQCYDMLEE